MPGEGDAIHSECNGKVVAGESAIAAWRVGQAQRLSLDRQSMVCAGHHVLESRYRQAAIEKHEASVILKVSVLGPLHANQLGGQHRETYPTHGYYGARIGHRLCHIAATDGLSLDLERRAQCERDRQCRERE